MFNRLTRRIAAHRRARTRFLELSHLSDLQLDDIGLRRADLPRLTGLWG